MSEGLKKDIIDGKIIDWSKLSIDELNMMKKEYKQKEKNILAKINEDLEENDEQR